MKFGDKKSDSRWYSTEGPSTLIAITISPLHIRNDNIHKDLGIPMMKKEVENSRKNTKSISRCLDTILLSKPLEKRRIFKKAQPQL